MLLCVLRDQGKCERKRKSSCNVPGCFVISRSHKTMFHKRLNLDVLSVVSFLLIPVSVLQTFRETISFIPVWFVEMGAIQQK